MGVHAASVYHGIRLTLVGQADAIDRWAETVARNRGCDLRVFVDEGEALAWLRGAGELKSDEHYYLYVKRGDGWVPLDISKLNEAELREVLKDPNHYRVVNWPHR
jgi:hypothetical protein